ncbi:MAG TPA: flagellar M-ring protein FliF C-terminal domain-containing protein, partial [Tepidisphaeraceae bacterium]|nr:flagellar M-ring protein FliF C-terminal domain-containing protein [Tepidisphaeraceae bacterium]
TPELVRQRNELLAELSYEQLLPADMRSGFDEMVSRTSMFDSQARTDQFMNRAREITLSQIISRYPSVRSATVTIDASRQRRIGADLRPTAAVSVQMKPGNTPDSKLVDAIANQIAGAIAGLSASNVSVIIDQRHYRTRDRENDPLAQGTDIIEMIHAHERRLEEKIRSQYYYVTGLAAGVTVQLDVGTRTQRSVKHDTIQQKERTNETETEETTSGQAASGEPGAVPNVGLEVPTGGGVAQNTSLRERTRSEFEMFPNTTEETLTTPAGTAKAVSASVRVPLSHFVAIWKRRARQ